MSTSETLNLREKLRRLGIDTTAEPRPAFIPAPPKNFFSSLPEVTDADEIAAARSELQRLAAEHAAQVQAQADAAAARAATERAHEALAQAVQRLTAAAVPGAPLTWALIRLTIPNHADDALAPALLAAAWTQGRIDRQDCRMRVWIAPKI